MEGRSCLSGGQWKRESLASVHTISQIRAVVSCGILKGKKRRMDDANSSSSSSSSGGGGGGGGGSWWLKRRPAAGESDELVVGQQLQAGAGRNNGKCKAVAANNCERPTTASGAGNNGGRKQERQQQQQQQQPQPRSSYSKIFGQYLPGSRASANSSTSGDAGQTAVADKSASGQRNQTNYFDQQQQQQRRHQHSSGLLIVASNSPEQRQQQQQQQHQQRQQSSSGRVVSALSRLSGSLVSRAAATDSRGGGGGESSSRQWSETTASGNSNDKHPESQASLTKSSANTKQQQQQQPPRRKAFAHLKRQEAGVVSSTLEVVQRSGSKLVTRIRDFNNNNNNSSSSSHSHSTSYNSASAHNKLSSQSNAVSGWRDETRLIDSESNSDEDEDDHDLEFEPQKLSDENQKRLEFSHEMITVSSDMGGGGGGGGGGASLSSRLLMSRRLRRGHPDGSGELLHGAFLVALGLLAVACVALGPPLAAGLQLQLQPQAQPLQSVQAPPFAPRSQQQQQQQANGNNNNNNNQAAPPPLGQPAAGSLVASVNCNKIRGHVTLTPNLQTGATSISAQISAGPPGEVYQWAVHQFPVKPGAAMCSCSSLILGSRLLDMSQLHGNLPSGDQEQNVQSSINLFGPDSPVGHSLLLRGLKTGVVACATFLPTSRKSNYRAKFHAPLSGSVTIFQTAFGTSFISHLMYSNGTRRHSMHQFDLVSSDDDIVTTPLQAPPLPLAAPPGGRQSNSADQSGGGGQFEQLAQREHEHELTQCRRLLSSSSNNNNNNNLFNNNNSPLLSNNGGGGGGGGGGEPLLRNSSYQLAVSTENFGMRGRTSLVLPQIPFETFSSVYVVIYSEFNSNEPIACAPLRFVKPKQAAAKFQTVSVQGSVLFSQDSPYDVTLARINLQLPNSDGHSYGIDELPMIIRRKSDTRVCPNIREIIYNPHHVEPSSVPPEGEATSDQYAVGDLSGKYGSLTGKSSEKIQVNDYNLPLFGATSIIGRAMTIYSADGVAIACSNVEPTTAMTTAFATFDYGIQGQFIFRQPANDCNGDTYVYIEVSKPVAAGQQHSSHSSQAQHQQQQHQHGDQSRSLDHNWHIHTSPVDSGLEHLSTTDCAPAGAHFNPYNTSTSGIYSRDCTPFNVLRCELGDLSAKMFTIDIPPYRVKAGQEPDIGKFFGTDIDLPLCGPASIVNRSVVVHVPDFGLQRLACSTVIEFKPRSSSR